MSSFLFIFVAAWVILYEPSVCTIQRHAAFTPLRSTSSGITITTDYPFVTIDNNHWRITQQSAPQTGYDLKLSLNKEWSFKPDIASTISLTMNGLPIASIDNEMSLYVVISVNDTQYLSVAVHLDINRNNYTTYPSLNISPNKKPVTQWISNQNIWEWRKDRISNENKWIDNEPPYSLRAQWPITFSFTNDPIHNTVQYHFYHNLNIFSVTGKQYLSSLFTANENIDIYIISDEPEEDFIISTIAVSLSYDTTNSPSTMPSISPTISTTTQLTTTASPAHTTKDIASDPIYSTDIASSTHSTSISSTNSLSTASTDIFSVIPPIYPSISSTHSLSTISTNIPSINPTISPSISPTLNPSTTVLVHPSYVTSTDSNSFLYLLIIVCCSILSFLLGISLGIVFCKNHKAKQKRENGHQRIPREESIEEEKEEKDHKGESEQKLMNDVVHIAVEKIPLDSTHSDAQSDEYEDMYHNITPPPNEPWTPKVTPMVLVSCKDQMDGAGVMDKEEKKEDEMRSQLEDDVALPQYTDNFGSLGYNSSHNIKEIGIGNKGYQTKLMTEIEKLSMSMDAIQENQPEGRSRR